MYTQMQTKKKTHIVLYFLKIENWFFSTKILLAHVIYWHEWSGERQTEKEKRNMNREKGRNKYIIQQSETQ